MASAVSPRKFPSLLDYYQAMLVKPDLCIRGDPDLANVQPSEVERRREPSGEEKLWLKQGGNAVVFKVTRGGRSYAIRLFTAYVPEAFERWEALRAHLAMPEHAHVRPYFLDFRLWSQPGQAFRMNAQWWPYVRMDFTPGTSLKTFAEAVGRRPNARELLLDLLERWTEMCAGLAQAHMSHSDLQPENVLVEHDLSYRRLQLRLIDYDTVFVPALAGRQSTAWGVSAYQHVNKPNGFMGEHADDFGALVIATSIRALANGVAASRDERELVIPADEIQRKAPPRVLNTLLGSSDPELQRLARLLLAAIEGPFASVPCVTESLDRTSAVVARLRAALSATPVDDEDIDRAAADPLLAGHAYVLQNQARIDQARTWSAVLRRFRALLADPAQDGAAVRYWDTNGLDAYAPAAIYADKVGTLRRRLEAWRAIVAALGNHDDEAVAASWDRQLFADYAPADARRDEIERAAQRARVRADLKHALTSDGHERIAQLVEQAAQAGVEFDSGIQSAIFEHQLHLAHEDLLERAIVEGSDWAIVALSTAGRCGARPAATEDRIRDAHARIAADPEVLGATISADRSLLAEAARRNPSRARGQGFIADLLDSQRAVMRFRSVLRSDSPMVQVAETWRAVSSAGGEGLLQPRERELGRRAEQAVQIARELELSPSQSLISQARQLGVHVPVPVSEAVRRDRERRLRRRVLAAALLRAGPTVIARAAARARVAGIDVDDATVCSVRRARLAIGRALRPAGAARTESATPS